MPTALITGASLGLGSEFAKIMARKGHDLILVARNASKLETLGLELSQKFRIQCHPIVADLSIPHSAEKLFIEVSKRKLEVHILINNAGHGICGPTSDYKLSDISSLLQLNITSLTELTRLFLPQMIARKSGCILNIGSIAGYQAGPWMNAYFASKAYVQSFGEALSVELQGTGVSVTTFCPGPTRTNFFESANIKIPKAKEYFYEDAKTCAARGINAMEQGKVISVDGIKNQMIVMFVRLIPRRIMRHITGRITKQQL